MDLQLFCIFLLFLNLRTFTFGKSISDATTDESEYERAESEESDELLEPVIRYNNVCGGVLAHDKSPIEISITLKNESKKCTWTIEAPEGRRIELFYHTMGCFSTVSDCTKDKAYVYTIYDGSSENDSDLLYDSRSVGSTLQPFISSGKEVTVDVYYRQDLRSEKNISYDIALRFKYV
ncbi:uncharacterized protein LOC116415992 [Nasonia vitripennis]|uniref:CUB domain-containing protein n=1 Tax=Nasonia vitripennis TaxID=7425 RepID=A0A7M7PZJ5_NASVI|nr:uncharacterized protein LOC116415992 [Nasonia vitripennis]